MCNYCRIVQYVTPAFGSLLDVLQDVHIGVGELEEEIQSEIHIESCMREGKRRRKKREAMKIRTI